jgi:hypothetical protein
VLAGRHAATVLALVAAAFAAVAIAFVLIVRNTGSEPAPGLESAQAMAHRLLRGHESIATEEHGDSRYVFRVVFQSTDVNAGSSTFPTHIGVAVCMRGDHATDAVRFSFLHFGPICADGRASVIAQETSRASDRDRAGGDFTPAADRYDEPEPQRLGAR